MNMKSNKTQQTQTQTHINRSKVTYSQNVVGPCSKSLPRRQNGRFGIDKELCVLVAVCDAVGEITVGPLVAVVGEHPVDGLCLLSALSLWKFDLVDLLRKYGLVVVFIQDTHRHPHCTVFGTGAAVRDHNL